MSEAKSDHESDSKAWLAQQVENERRRLADAGAKAIPLPVKNCGVVLETRADGRDVLRAGDISNRMEVDSGMDFGRVTQVMVSPETVYPFEKGYSYVHVLCFTAASASDNGALCLLLPYVFAPHLRKADDGALVAVTPEPTDHTTNTTGRPTKVVANNLQSWIFVNAKHATTRFHIKEYHQV
ncbi:hypothetical protein PYCC9005_005210 [Savitreella phatthalungensis]